MATVNFRELSIGDAEDVIAEIWNCLEEYRIPSPRMTFEFRRGGEIRLGCRFDEPLSAQLVALRLSAWLVTGQRSAEIAGRGDGPVAPYSLLCGGRRVAPRGASHLATTASLRQLASSRAR